MAGSIVGKVNCYLTPTVAKTQQQEGFKGLFDFMEQMVTAGYATRIALQWGLVAAPYGLGTGYHDSAAAFGENAFAVYRMNGASSGNTDSRRDGADLPDFDYYVLIQWADTSVFGAAPGDPGKISAATSDGCAISVAARADGTSPWAGGTANDGTDSKGATVWTAGGSTLLAYPLSNAYTGGSHLAAAENMQRLWDVTGTGVQMIHMVGNADGFVLVYDSGADGSMIVHYFGIYDPRAGLTPDMPLVCISSTTAFPWPDGTATIWGNLAGNLASEGAVVGELASDLMSHLSIGLAVHGVLQIYAQPNTQFDPPRFDTFPIRIIQRSAGRSGYVGDIDPTLLTVCFGAPTNSLSADGLWAYMGSTTENQYKAALVWDTSIGVPTSKIGRQGQEF